MKLAVSGFVDQNEGSVAGANAILLRLLLERGVDVSFFSKAGFVDPRTLVIGTTLSDKLRFVDCTNSWTDKVRGLISPKESLFVGKIWGIVNSFTYNRKIVRAMRREEDSDADLWLGTWATGRSDRPVISFVQGPPGTDARSIFNHRELIERLAGHALWLKLAVYANWRLNVGLPNFRISDHIICGSQWSRKYLEDHYKLSNACTHALPYPVDLKVFSTTSRQRPSHGSLRVFWLGRFAPRKRLDLFLTGIALAIRGGCDVEAWIVGQSAFVPGYERLIHEFPYPEKLKHWKSVPRCEVPAMFSEVDVIAQPSDEENFGSSVAEALACGVPAIVGATNGTGDYLCERSIRLNDDSPETFADAIDKFLTYKRSGELSDPYPSRASAVRWFDPIRVTDGLQSIVQAATL